MRRRFRAVSVLVGVVTLFAGVSLPSAHADTVGHFTFASFLTVGPGIAYPCIGDAGGLDATKCAFTLAPKPTPGGKPGDTMVNITAPNAAPASLAGAACVGSAANATKPAKAAWEAGLCTLGAAGGAQGYCGAMTGTLTGTVTGVLPIFGIFQTYDFNVKFTIAVEELYFAGAITKRTGGKTGWVRGTATTHHVDLPNDTCANKLTNKTFTLVGEAAFKILN